MLTILIESLITLSKGNLGIFVAGLALLLMFIGLIRAEDPWLMVIAAILSIPSTYIMGGPSGSMLVIRFLPLLQFISAFAISKNEMLFAWFFSIPAFGMLIYFIIRIIISGGVYL
mgnify:CR=1 FL=1